MRVCPVNTYFNDDSAEELFCLDKHYNYGTTVSRKGVSFLIDGNASMNNVCCVGQEIEIASFADTLWVLGYSEETVLKAEISIQTEKDKIYKFLEFPCYQGMEKLSWVYDKNMILKNRNTMVFDAIPKNDRKNYLYACKIAVGNRFVKSVTLPDYNLMHILAITIDGKKRDNYETK